MSLPEAAVFYASRGWKILPLKGKEPDGILAPHAWESATSDVTQVEKWWRMRPSNNIGLVLKSNGLVAVDVDPRKGGIDLDNWPAYVESGAPRTLVQESGGGGWHYVFDASDELDSEFRGSVKGVKGTDVKWKGYVVAAPSMHPDTGKQYTWVSDVTPIKPDEWLRSAIVRSRSSTESGELFYVDPETGDKVNHEAICDGNWDGYASQREALIALARSAWAYRVPKLVIKVMLYAAISNMEQLKKKPWTQSDCDAIVESTTQVAPGKSEEIESVTATPEEQAVARKLVGLDDDADEANVQAFDERLNQQVARLLVDQAARALVEARRLAEVRGARVVRSGRDYALVEQPVAVLPDVLAAEVNLLGGPSGEGKSLVARDWVFDVIERGGTALWIPSEGMHDFAQRFVASPRWERCADGLSVLDDAVNLKHEVDWLLNEVERVDLVVFDVIYGMGMDDDNGVKDALPIINALKRISAEWKCATLAIGHSGHSTERRFRGSSAWRQLAAVEWYMGDGTLSCPKSKIANASALAKTYVVEYPEVRWTSVSEHLRQASGREEVIRRDFEQYPGSSDTDRAQRLAELLKLSDRTVRRLVAEHRKGLGQG